MKFGDERLPQRFWDKVDVQDSGCWLWTASISNHTGYGWFNRGGEVENTHRIMCEVAYGPPENGSNTFAMHSCDVRHCVNPEHLRWGSPKENSQDMAEKGRGRKPYLSHCKKGHEFTPENTYVRPGSKTRACRECHRQWWREWNSRRNQPDYVPDRVRRIKETKEKNND